MAEAKSVCLAFGIEGDYRFYPIGPENRSLKMRTTNGRKNGRKLPRLANGMEVTAESSKYLRYFQVDPEPVIGDEPQGLIPCEQYSYLLFGGADRFHRYRGPERRFGFVQIALWSDGTVDYEEAEERSMETVIMLAKGLFHLNLLTAEVESLMGLDISAHQRLEWTLEYDARVVVKE